MARTKKVEFTDRVGYVRIYQPNHHRANKHGYVLEHIYVAEKKINRELSSQEIVHHINKIKDDNSPGNLIVMLKGEHISLHTKGLKPWNCDLRVIVCKQCGKEFKRPPSEEKQAKYCSNQCRFESQRGKFFLSPWKGKRQPKWLVTQRTEAIKETWRRKREQALQN